MIPVVHCHKPYVRTPSPRPSPLRGEGEVCRARFIHIQRASDLLRAFRSRLPLPSGERDGVRGLGRFGLRTAALAVAILASSARADLVPYKIVGDAIPASL